MSNFATPGLLGMFVRHDTGPDLGTVVGWEDGYLLYLDAAGEVAKIGITPSLRFNGMPAAALPAPSNEPEAWQPDVSLIAYAARRVRESREAVRLCPPVRNTRVEREATLDHYVGELLALLSGAST